MPKIVTGEVLAFGGQNWKLVKDSGWEYQRFYLANGMEKHVGTRILRGQEHNVFRCLNDEYVAQPVGLEGS